MKFYLIQFFFLPFILFGQIDKKDYDLVNPKTKQWLHCIGSGGKVDNKYTFDYLIVHSKQANGCETKRMEIPYSHSATFIDSLKKSGFKAKIKYIDRKTDYKASLELISMSFDKMSESDSIFKFIYKATLTHLKTNTGQSVEETIYRPEKEIVLKAFEPGKSTIKSIQEIKGTTIIEVELYSEGLYNSKYSLGIFAPVHFFYF